MSLTQEQGESTMQSMKLEALCSSNKISAVKQVIASSLSGVFEKMS